MKLLYLSLSYVPSRRASSIHVMRMCSALARHGHQVSLVTKNCPQQQEAGILNDHAFYGVSSNFAIVKLPRPAWRGGGLVFETQVWRLLRKQRRLWDLVYSRHLPGAWLAAQIGYPVVYEAHSPPRGRLMFRLHRSLLGSPQLKRQVVISSALKKELHKAGLLPRHGDTVVTPDAADPLPSGTPDGTSRLPGRRPRIGYVGHLYPGRGVEAIVELAERLPHCEFHLVGGRQEELAQWGGVTPLCNLTFHGFVPPCELANHYGSFDILLMPYQPRVGVASGRSDTSDWMSPMKMFEYMASGKAIVASDMPVLREVLEHRRNAWLVPPQDLDAWQEAVQLLIGDTPLRERLGEAARMDLLANYTWDARARAVLEGL